MCGHIEDAIDLDILRSVLIVLVSALTENEGPLRRSGPISPEENAIVANVHYNTCNAGFLSALDRTNILLELSLEAQEMTLFSDRIGVDNIPYLRLFLSKIPNPARVWEVPDGANLRLLI